MKLDGLDSVTLALAVVGALVALLAARFDAAIWAAVAILQLVRIGVWRARAEDE